MSAVKKEIGLLKYMLEHPELNSTKSKELDWN